MTQYTWTCQAIKAGGVLTVSRQRFKFKAVMTWPHLVEDDPIEKEGGSIEEAMEFLEEALQDDASNEMIEAGAV